MGPRHLDPDRVPGDGRMLIAYSGGPDSTCLMHQLATAGSRRPLLALHVDHGLDPESRQRAENACERAHALGVAAEILDGRISDGGGGPEAVARRARYAALVARMNPGDVLLTAHHADDQVETVLLRLLRGAGPTGLGGMPRTRRIGPGWLHRPLLDWTRCDILAWLERHEVEALDDPANRNLRFDRNFIRHDLLPLLEQRWPGARRSVLHSAHLCREAGALLDEIAGRDLQSCLRGADRLDLAAVLALPRFRAAEVLRRWCRHAGLAPPPGARLDNFMDQLVDAAMDRTPEMRWDNAVLRRHGNALWLDLDPSPESNWKMDWQPPEPAVLPDTLGTMRLCGLRGQSPPGKWQIRSGKNGEAICLPGQRHRRRVKELLRESGVPPWRRDQWPRVWRDGRLVAVGDRWLDGDFAAWLETAGARLVWERPSSGHPPR